MRPTEDHNLHSELRIAAIRVGGKMVKSHIRHTANNVRAQCEKFLKREGILDDANLTQLVNLVEEEYEGDAAQNNFSVGHSLKFNDVRIAAIFAADELQARQVEHPSMTILKNAARRALGKVLGPKKKLHEEDVSVGVDVLKDELSGREPIVQKTAPPKPKKAPPSPAAPSVARRRGRPPQNQDRVEDEPKVPASDERDALPPTPTQARPLIKHTLSGKVSRRGRPRKNHAEEDESIQLEIDDEPPKKKTDEDDEEPTEKKSKLSEDRIGRYEGDLDELIPSVVRRETDDGVFSFDRDRESDDEDEDEEPATDTEEVHAADLAESNGHDNEVKWTYVESHQRARRVTTKAYEPPARDTADRVMQYLERQDIAEQRNVRVVMNATLLYLQKQYTFDKIRDIAQQLCNLYGYAWEESTWERCLDKFLPAKPQELPQRPSVLDHAKDYPLRVRRRLERADDALCAWPQSARCDTRSIVRTTMHMLHNNKMSYDDKVLIACALAKVRGFPVTPGEVPDLLAPPTECKQVPLEEKKAAPPPEPDEDEDDAAFGGIARAVTGRARCKPGTEEKVLILSGRYSAGLPLNNPRDLTDHGPREEELNGNHDRPKTPVGTSWQAWTED